MKTAWKLYRDHLRWNVWDDVALPILILLVVGVGLYWITHPHPAAQAQPRETRMERTVKDGFVYVRKLGPKD